MSSKDLLSSPPVTDPYHAVAALAFDAGFEARWAAWIARGEAHERRVARRVVVIAGVVATGAALFYTFMYS